MSVMLGIVADSLPKSNDLTILGWYLLYSLILGTVAVVASVTVDFFVHKVHCPPSYNVQVTKGLTTEPPAPFLYRWFQVKPKAFKSVVKREEKNAENVTMWVAKKKKCQVQRERRRARTADASFR